MVKKNKIKTVLSNHLKKQKAGSIIMIELPTNKYFEASSESVDTLTRNDFEGIYISFQRPFNNLSNLFKKSGINIKKILFIDIASSSLKEKHKGGSDRCVHISEELNVDELVRAIYTSLPKLKGEKIFVFIDSLSTVALYLPLSEVMRFSEFLIRTVKNEDPKRVNVIFNVSNDLKQKKFIADIATHADEVISW